MQFGNLFVGNDSYFVDVSEMVVVCSQEILYEGESVEVPLIPGSALIR